MASRLRDYEQAADVGVRRDVQSDEVQGGELRSGRSAFSWVEPRVDQDIRRDSRECDRQQAALPRNDDDQGDGGSRGQLHHDYQRR